MMSEKLEPCPFCQGETGALMRDGGMWRIWCLRPASVCGYIGPDKPTEVAAIAHHNRALLSTSSAVRGMREALEWRSIATAPKDGSEFIAFQDGDVYRCAWRVVEPDESPGHEGWWDFSNSSFEEPTNWLPMPALSVEGEDEQARGQGRSESTNTKRHKQMSDLSTMTSGGSSAPADPASPLMQAWLSFQKSESYANSKKWAAYPEHLEGSLWAMFMTGFAAAQNPPVPEPVYKAIERILDDNSAWIAAPNQRVVESIALQAVVAAHTIIAKAEGPDEVASQCPSTD